MASDRFQCLSKRNKAQKDSCLKHTKENEIDVYVPESRAFVDLWVFEKNAKLAVDGINEEIVSRKSISQFQRATTKAIFL
ncbi:hypothetical protein [Vibrio jasicida]|uniref:hypothetical protein n=1 Tax=Vibrio jasicida TaxID=766224 RepID=UPI000CE449E8|nr:hypothetical protein [Vibrio jasicida]NOJ17308.1 hypothetical protein [Vibrio jasicida]